MEQMTNSGEESRGIWPLQVRRAIALAALMAAIFLAVQTVNAIKGFNYIGSDSGERNLITVTGEGEAFAVPDIAEINFSVVEEAETVPEAQEKATTKMSAVLAALRQAGIAEKDIQTVGYNVYPKYEYDRVSVPCYSGGICPPASNPVISGYEVSQSISLKIRDVKKAGEILAIVGGLKVSNVSGISFTIDDEEKVKDEARDEAIADAKDKAEQLADSLGVKLVRLASYNESGGPYSYYKSVALGVGGADSSSVPAPELPVGENKISSSVTLTYEIR